VAKGAFSASMLFFIYLPQWKCFHEIVSRHTAVKIHGSVRKVQVRKELNIDIQYIMHGYYIDSLDMDCN
jgi:hypothetical protein